MNEYNWSTEAISGGIELAKQGPLHLELVRMVMTENCDLPRVE